MHEYFHIARQSTCNPPSRAAVKEAQTVLAAKLLVDVINRLAAYSVTSPISIAIDGWTNTRHHKVTNVLCLCGGQAYFWCSIVNRYDRSTAQWLVKPIADAITDLLGKGIRIIALVADNEAVNGALYNLLTPRFPFLLLSPCAAHTIQLCVNKAMNVSGIYEVMKTMEGVVKQFRKGKKSKSLRLQLANLQRQSVGERGIKALVIPCDTRWSSHRAAGVRLLELQHFIVICELPHRPDASFWPLLKEFMQFLKPFQTATDIIQADNSTLYSVYQQFKLLLSYIDTLPVSSSFSSVMPVVHNIIVTNWKEHVNVPAAVACAWMSFDSDAREFDTTDLTATRKWFVSYALTYAKQYHLKPGWSDGLILGKLEEMWGQFTGRAVGTPFAELDAIVARMRSSQLLENRRQLDPPQGEWVSTWYPVSVWRVLESEVPLFAHPAIALLCVAGSEAAVERSFSAQDAVHTKKRNRLTDQSVQNEMFIRFNFDAVKGVKPGEGSRVMGGRCIELTPEFGERQRVHGSVKALFQAITIEAKNQEAPAAAVVPEEEEMKGDEPDGKDEKSDDSDSDFVSGSESDLESDSNSSDEEEEDSEEEERLRPVSRQASIARQVAVEAFITRIIDENKWSTATNWKDRELSNIIESASLEHNIRTTTAVLKTLIKARVMSG
jgi:hypothetical protein